MKGLFDFMKYRSVVVLSSIGTGALLTSFLKDSMQGPHFTNPIRADEKVVIVTGSNTGIGKETVLELAKRGAHVYMACRDMNKCKEARDEIAKKAKNRNVFCRECDLASFKSIRDFVSKFKQDESRLDVLINNAGVMRCPRTTTKDGIELQLGVNHMGHFLLTNLLLDYLKKSTPSRIVVVSSIAHTRGTINLTDLNSDQSYDEGAAYNQSKLANVYFTQELAAKLNGSGVTVNALHPGLVDTEIGRHMGILSGFLGKIFVKPLIWPFLKSSKFGAQTTLYVALDPELQTKTGLYYSDCAETKVAEVATDAKIGKWLWKVSEKWTGCEYS